MSNPVRIVELEDFGQDFTEFHLNARNVITDAKPFQSWLWKGYTVSPRIIRRGTQLSLSKHGHRPMRLRYRVVSVRRVSQ